MRMRDLRDFLAVTLLVVALAGLVVALPMWGLPKYRVYSQDHRGQAALARAENERRVLIEQAEAERQALVLRSLGEAEAAQHTAEAIRIVGEAAQTYPEYRDQEFIRAFGQAIQDGSIRQIIYVPTEGNIPITEAQRLR